MQLLSKVNVGWDPMVMQVITNYDGGKTLIGFGRTAATMYAGWVVKMWGEKGTTNCGDGSKITGYVTMAVNVNSAITASSDCSLTSSAKTQWAFTSLATNGYAGTAASKFTTIFLNGAEESKCGKASDAATCATTANSEPLVYAVGGCTWRVYLSLGVGAYSIWASAVSMEGVAAAGYTTSTGHNAGNTTFNVDHLATNGTGNEIYTKAADDVMDATIGSFVTNSCLTGVGPNLDADVTNTNDKQYLIFGFTGAIHTCLDVAIDGYTVFGHPLVYAIDDKMETSILNKAATDNATLTNVELFAATPYTGTEGDTSAATEKAVNQGQIRAIVEVVTTGALYHCAVFTASEYFHESGFICFAGAHDAIIDDATTTYKFPTAGNKFTKANYGAVWNGWCYEAAESVAGTVLTSQTPDYCMFVGTR